MDQNRNRLTRKMLPFLMKPTTLLTMIVMCILGEVMWMYLGVLTGSQWECVGLFVVGSILGFIGGIRTSNLWDEYYVESRLRRVKLMSIPMGRRNAIFIFTALGIPMILSFVTATQHPFLPALQSYIFGFICGMNWAIYRWARQLPKE